MIAPSPEPQSVRTLPRILIVDDNPTNVKVLQTRLATEGYEIVTAADGEEGLAAAREHVPDLILRRLMPKVDGFEVCRRLRADPDSVRRSSWSPRWRIRRMVEVSKQAATVPDETGGPPRSRRACLDAQDQAPARHGGSARRRGESGTPAGASGETGWRTERVVAWTFISQLAELIVGGAGDPLKNHRRE
jgi:CheY-like chemotaxis protein